MVTEPQRTVPVIDGFQVVERTYSPDESLPTVGLANIHAVVPGIEANKEKILAATRVLAEFGVNVAIFPELALSGYFWDDEPACRAYMDQALTENHLDWIDEALRPMCGGDLQAIVLNNLTAGPDGRYRNRTMVISELVDDPLDPDSSYDKVYVPGIEKRYTASGTEDRLVLRGSRIPATFGFTTCYDYLFIEELRQYAFEDGVDGIIQVASWRAESNRDYPYMNVRRDRYYGELWDMTMAASSAQNQVWTFAANAVGRHGITGEIFWGGSGVWAPSGICLVQASHYNDELLVVHNVDIIGARRFELADFDYGFDFRQVHRQMPDAIAEEEPLD